MTEQFDRMFELKNETKFLNRTISQRILRNHCLKQLNVKKKLRIKIQKKIFVPTSEKIGYQIVTQMMHLHQKS